MWLTTRRCKITFFHTHKRMCQARRVADASAPHSGISLDAAADQFGRGVRVHRRRYAVRPRHCLAPVRLQPRRRPTPVMLPDPLSLVRWQTELRDDASALPRGRRAPPAPPTGPPSARTPAETAAIVAMWQLVPRHQSAWFSWVRTWQLVLCRCISCRLLTCLVLSACIWHSARTIICQLPTRSHRRRVSCHLPD